MKQDDAAAFRTLYGRYWKDLYKTAYARFHNQQDAEDALHDLFTWLWEKRKDLDIRTSVQAYLQTALRHRIIRSLGRADLHQKAIHHLLYRMTEMQSSVLDVMMATDVEQTLSKAIDRFPETMKNVFMLRNEDFTVREIADALGLADQTVRNNIAGSLQRLKSVLEKEHPELSATIIFLLGSFLLSS